MVIPRSMMYNRTKKNKDMNNNIIKSLRRTLLCTVAAAAVTIGFTACADETFTTQNANAPANDNGYKLIVPSNIGGGDTRAIAYDETQGKFVATFETTDNIFVYDVTKKADGMKKLDRKPDQEDDEWEATYLHPNANAKDVTLEGELTFYSRGQDDEYYVVTPEKGDELVLIYNNANRGISYSRDFSYENMNKDGDFAAAKVKIESMENGVIKTSKATFTHTQSIYKIKFNGLTDKKIKKIVISSEQKNLVSSYSPADESNSFGKVSYTYAEDGTDPSDDLIFMLRFAENPYYSSSAGDVIGFRALTSDNEYYYGIRAVENNLENGLYYDGEVAMEYDGKAMTWTNDDTRESVQIKPWYNSIVSTEAPYTFAGKGYDVPLYWIGGENTLTFNNFYLNNEERNPLELGWNAYAEENPEKTKEHHLLLNGVNILNRKNTSALNIYNCSVDISAASDGAQLNIENSDMYVLDDATMTLKSGEINIDGTLEFGSNAKVMVEGGVLTTNWVRFNDWGEEPTSYFIISKDGKVRARNFFDKERIKAAEGYVLNQVQDGDYVVYTVTEDDGSGKAKSISVTPTAIIGYSSLLGNVGVGTRLEAYVNPVTADQSVTWKTINPDMVEVNEYGWVNPMAVGTATVTATTKDGSDLSASCVVTIKPLAGIRYEKYEMSVTPETQPFTNPLLQDGSIQSVEYTSSDESVATVDLSTGEVTIKDGATEGQTFTITATAIWGEDDRYFYPDDYRTARYTVKLVSSTGVAGRENYSSEEW